MICNESDATPKRAGIYLWWLPLGAGGWFVRFNGRVYEAIQAQREHRMPQDLYHTALEVYVPEGRYVIENSWPIPDGDVASRGVVVQGPVFDRRLSRFRPLRYEIRRWRDGIIDDAAWAIGSPQLVTEDVDLARAVLDRVLSVPVLVWGRDDLATGEMWNSNSVIAWVLASAGLRPEELRPPRRGSRTGLLAGLAVAGRARTADRQPRHSYISASPDRWMNGARRPSRCKQAGGRLVEVEHTFGYPRYELRS